MTVPEINIKKKWYHGKSTAEEFHLNDHIIGFRRQTQKLEVHYMSYILILGVKVSIYIYIYVVVHFFPFAMLIFHCYFSVLIYDNEYQTKENQN